MRALASGLACMCICITWTSELQDEGMAPFPLMPTVLLALAVYGAAAGASWAQGACALPGALPHVQVIERELRHLAAEIAALKGRVDVVEAEVASALHTAAAAKAEAVDVKAHIDRMDGEVSLMRMTLAQLEALVQAANAQPPAGLARFLADWWV